MNEMMATKQISSFETLLGAYHEAGVEIEFALDGGAGAGHTAQRMLDHLRGGTVYAFEPFPGNHRFFEGRDARIVLFKNALAAKSKTMTFRVPGVVSADSAWGQGAMEGYSSLGYLVDDSDDEPAHTDIEVDCVRADEVIASRIDFVKLDLQGGELAALRGMTGFLSEVMCMWIEFTGQPELMDYLANEGFILFDTEFFFWGEPTPRARELFDVSGEGVPLSTGQTTWTGFKKSRWKNFEVEFHTLKQEIRLGWTDLVCINKKRLDEFVAALQHL